MTSAEAEELLNDYDSAGHYLAAWAGELQGRLTGKKPIPPPDTEKVDHTRDYEVLSIGRTHHRTGTPISAVQWIAMYDEHGRLTLSGAEIKKMIFFGVVGLEDDLRSTAWKYLLNLYPWDSTESERSAIMQSKTQLYSDMKHQWQTILADATQVATAQAIASGTKMDEETDALAGDEKEDGDVVSKLKERRYRVEKDVVRTDRTVAFFAGDESDERPILDPVASSISVEPPRVFSRNLEMLKDVLITYTVYNFELGYVQGMNDLLAPVLAVMQDEVEGFWTFAEYMEVMKYNFYRDQSGMRKQLHRLELLIKFVDPPLYAHLEHVDSINLFCCFRWLLVSFKREFEFSDILRLWEVTWACPFTNHLHLFVAFAILNKHRQNLMTKCRAFDECLKYMNDLSGNIELEDVLERAEVLFEVFRQMITIAAWEKLHINIELGLSKSSPTSQKGRDTLEKQLERLELAPQINLPQEGDDATKNDAPPPQIITTGLQATTRARAPSNSSSNGSPTRGRKGSHSSAGSSNAARSTSASPSRNGNQVSLEVDVDGLWELLTLLEINK
ncbi:GTPase activating protein [Irineochytrium annulatum]|nr:GTPase activating protein [Irineochytrium annulatum]